METTKIDGDVSVTVDEQIARIIEQAQEQGLQLTGEGGLLPDMIRQAGGRGGAARRDVRPPGIRAARAAGPGVGELPQRRDRQDGADDGGTG
jgi:hypothetical protein